LKPELISRETAIGLGVSALAVVAMAFDHLIDVEEGFPADPPAFLIAVAIILVLALIVFGRLVPRTKSGPALAERAAKRGFVCGILAVPSIGLIWLGVPFVVAGGAIALGLLGRGGDRTQLATAAIVLGSAVLLVCTAFSDWTSSS
jgi:hypothetical protein